MNYDLTNNASLKQLIYLSNSNFFYDDADLEALLKTSRRNNIKKNITGMLLFHNGMFMQILEGPEKTVTDVYAIIKADTRHRGCIKVAEIDVTERQFGNWSMAFQKPTANNALGFSNFMNNVNTHDLKSNSGEALKLMLSFREKANVS